MKAVLSRESNEVVAAARCDRLAENAAFLKATLDGVDREPVNDARPGVDGGTVVGTTVDLFSRERVLWDGGYRLIAGIDEVGRAAWAGPLVAAAVILPPDFHSGGIGDGKVLTAKQRERAHARVIAEATAWAICLEEAATINERGLHKCNIDLLARAAHELKVPPDYVLVVVFTDLPTDRAPGVFGDVVQQLAVPSYVEDGILFGPYYEGNEQTAIYNSSFRPFESPVPFLFVRHGVVTDWKFFLDNEEWLNLWAHRYGESGVQALAEELRRLPWRANPPQAA